MKASLPMDVAVLPTSQDREFYFVKRLAYTLGTHYFVTLQIQICMYKWGN